MGMRTDLTGGGLIRSAGGWPAVKTLRRQNRHEGRCAPTRVFLVSAKRIKLSQQACDRRFRLKARGVDLDVFAHRVSELLDIPMDARWSGTKHRHVVKVRSLLCYWAMRELRMSMSELARRFEVSDTVLNKSVLRGNELAKKQGFEFE